VSAELPPRGRIKELDLMRGFAILGIVAIHAGSFSEAISGPSWIPGVTDYIAHLADFGVPLFFMISGFLLAARPISPGGTWGFYRRRLMTVVPPYLFFSTIYAGYNYWVLGRTDLVQAAWSYLLFDSVGVFWFLGAMVQMYLLFPFLSAWLDRLAAKGRSWMFLAAAAALYIAWYAFLEGAVAGGIDSLGLPVVDMGERLSGFLFPGYLIFFALGMHISRTPSTFLRGLAETGPVPVTALVLVVPIGLQMIESEFWWAMAVVPYSVLASSLVYRASARLVSRPGRAFSVMDLLGRYSFGIYMVHILALAFASNRLWAIGLDAEDAVFYVLLYIIAIVVSVLSLFVLNLLPYGPMFSGVRGRDGKRRGLLAQRTEAQG
jgi:peptidoglycan/LPS O-acetylase OafA/YrhL